MLSNYTIHYDIASVILLLILGIIYFPRKNIPSFGNKTFKCLILFIGAAAVCEIILSLSLQLSPALSPWMISVLGVFYFFIITFLPFLSAAYCFILCDPELLGIRNEKYKKIVISLFLLPYFIGIFWIIFEAGDGSVRFLHYTDPLFIYCSLMPCLYMLTGMTFLFKKRQSMPVHYFSTVFFFCIVCTAGVILRLFFPRLLIINFGIAVSLYFLYMNVHKPDNFTNSLTGLFNTSAFALLVDEKFVYKDSFFVIGIILEDINFLNSTFGIKAVDSLLKLISQFFMQTSVQFKKEVSSEVYSISTEEFCITIKTQNAEVVQDIAEHIREKFDAAWELQNTTVKLFARICLINCPADAESSSEILDLLSTVGEQHQYRTGRTVSVNTVDTSRIRLRRQLDRTIKTSIQNDLISVWYQPIYSISKQRVIGAEALIRMKDENGNFISPEDFIPVAEKNGTILRIGEFVLERVCSMLAELNIKNYGIEKIDINLSMVQCMQKKLAEQIIAITDIYRVPRQVLDFEITETAAAYLPKMLLDNMEQLNASGAECSLDDYGSGYSNMTYLLELPFKMIKIDKGIVWSADKKLRSRTALAHTVTMIKSLGMQVLAEGVETLEQIEWLASLECDYLQGYYFSKPLPQKEFLAFLAQEMQRQGYPDPEHFEAKLESDIAEELEELEEAESAGEF